MGMSEDNDRIPEDSKFLVYTCLFLFFVLPIALMVWCAVFGPIGNPRLQPYDETAPGNYWPADEEPDFEYSHGIR